MHISFEDQIRERAYQIWLAGGMNDGMAHEHWVSAEQAVREEIAPKAEQTSTTKSKDTRATEATSPKAKRASAKTSDASKAKTKKAAKAPH